MMLRPALLCAALALSACGTVPLTEAPARRESSPSTLPPMKTFAVPQPQATSKSNATLAQDFMDLSFRMESGRVLPILTRFQGPITVRAVGSAPASLPRDLAQLLARLRSEAGIDIQNAPSGATSANVTIETMPRHELQRYVPQAACFVVPRVGSWAEYKRNRRSGLVDWTTLTQREQVAIFIPSDVAPQEIRDCLHEELAQALGPLNDLYRLPDSVFNDDNFHAVLTGFDMLMLRIYYAPELRNGMSQSAVAAALPGILARINPAGQNRPASPVSQTPRVWIDAIEAALGPRTSMSGRLISARRAVRIAQDQRWHDSRFAFSLFALGRLALGTEPEVSLASFLEAGRIYARSPETKVQSAHVAMQMAAFALTAGQSNDVISLIDAHIGTVTAAQNAGLLATMLMLKSEALQLEGQLAQARAVRLDSLAWARYGFGSDREVRARFAEIASLSPRRPQT